MDCIESFRRQDASTRKRNIAILSSIVIFILALTIILIVVLIPKKQSPGPAGPGGTDRIECPGFNTAKECTAHGCTYESVLQGPDCYFPKDSFGYSLKETKDDRKKILSSRSANTPYGPSITNVAFEVSYITENILRVKLYDSDNDRYEVPVQKEFPLLKNRPQVDENKLAYEVRVTNNETFAFQITRTDGTTLWDTSIGGLVMNDQYLQIASYLPSNNIYGLGEHVHTTLRRNLDYISWPMFSRDRTPEGGSKINLYGMHPFYTCLENSTKSHGVLLLNSNAMEVTVMPHPAISYRTIGGILDLFFFVGDNPEHVVQLYTSLIGRPVMPPYWGLGFQLSRYGYNNLENVKKAVERTRNASIAQDVQYLDIDHMFMNRDFTYDNKSFAGLLEYIEKTKREYDLKWIIIIDPAIEAAKDYKPYEDGLKKKVFVKRPSEWKPEMFPPEVRDEISVYGKVWPHGVVAFPDFFLKEAQDWWIETLTDFHKTLPFDGIWIDMNEPSNFGTNGDNPFYCKTSDCWFLSCPESKREIPPYNPLKKGGSDRISKMTLCMDSVQSDGTRNFSHYDVHGLYGWSETVPTLQAARTSTGTRSVVISRSTYPSSGRYAGHWLGDNKSTWEDLRYSIIGMMEFNLFGIPYIGADVCGFDRDTTEELCIRWMQLGAFYPYFRNHNGMGQKEQDPAALGPKVEEAARAAVQRRYALQPYLYTLFHRAHVDGSTVVRPLFHEFPADNVTWDISEQFMWGKCLMISPIIHEGNTSVKIYLPPEAEWWLFNFNRSKLEQSTPDYVERTDEEGLIPVHIRSGCVIPSEPYHLKGGPKKEKELELYVFLDNNNEASGEMFFDDGISENTHEEKKYNIFTFTAENCTFELKQERDFKGYEYPTLRQISFYKKIVNDHGKDPYPAITHVLLEKKINEVERIQIPVDECR